MLDDTFKLGTINHPQGGNYATFRNDTRYTGFPPDSPPWVNTNNGSVKDIIFSGAFLKETLTLVHHLPKLKDIYF